MKQVMLCAVLLPSILWSLVLFAGSEGVRKGNTEYFSPSALATDEESGTIYVAAETGRQIMAFDTASGEVASVIHVPEPPTGLVLSADGSYLYITGAAPEGRVYVLDVAASEICCDFPVGHTPMSPVLKPDGKTLYVCNRFSNDISVLDLTTTREVARIPVSREPIAACITPDGRFLFIANHLPADAADSAHVAARLDIVDTDSEKVVSSIALPDGSTGLRGICISPEGKYVFVTHVLARYRAPTTQLGHGWINTNAVSIVDVGALKLLTTVLLDDIDRGAANPWGITCTPDGKFLCVTHSGSHEISVIDLPALLGKLSGMSENERAGIADDLSFLSGLRRRVSLAGNGPRGLTVLGSKIYIAEYFTGSLGVVDIGLTSQPRARSVALGPRMSIIPVRRGEMLFNDANICFQNWQTCTSCHPDARTDGLNWDLLNDGFGNPKNSKSLLLSHRTPPVMITGVRDRAETAVRAGIRYIMFTAQPEEYAVAIDEYLKSLQPVPSPYLVNGTLSESAEKGKRIFQEAECVKCHPAPLYTDLKKYEAGTGRGREGKTEFDTPTLVEIWRTAPYLYDGRSVSMEDILTRHNQQDKHGKTSHLTQEQVSDLAEFILSQ